MFISVSFRNPHYFNTIFVHEQARKVHGLACIYTRYVLLIHFDILFSVDKLELKDNRMTLFKEKITY